MTEKLTRAQRRDKKDAELAADIKSKTESLRESIDAACAHGLTVNIHLGWQTSDCHIYRTFKTGHLTTIMIFKYPAKVREQCNGPSG